MDDFTKDLLRQTQLEEQFRRMKKESKVQIMTRNITMLYSATTREVLLLCEQCQEPIDKDKSTNCVLCLKVGHTCAGYMTTADVKYCFWHKYNR